jgi:hypothetical protein
MTEHSPEVTVVYRLDALHRDLEVVGVYTQRKEAEAHLADIAAERCPITVSMSMDSALATLREEGRFTLSHVLQHRLDQLSERVGQLSAVVACQLEAA